MVSPVPPLPLSTEFDPETGRPIEIAPGLVRVTAPNAGPYTFTGTNTFLVGESTVAVIDPGPDDATHLTALRQAIAGRKVEAIILTHTHKDHCSLAGRLKAETGAPLWFEGKHRLSRRAGLFERNVIASSSDWTLVPDRTLRDGEIVTVAGMEVAVIATPGHCANHLAFGIVGSPFVLSGDHVMGWSSTLVSVPDGSMGDYLSSLDRIIASPFTHYLPAHGGPVVDGRSFAKALKAHREVRNAQIIEAVTGGARSIGALRRAIYPELKPILWPAARMTLRAHVEFLAERGMIEVKRTPFGVRIGPN
jgi:glyoxylase-like metal-dependent hydrolase (beta-lactamase superfamily II)